MVHTWNCWDERGKEEHKRAANRSFRRADAVAGAIGVLVRTLLEEFCEAGFERLVLTGGSTASRVLEAIGLDSIRITGEFEPGIVIGTIVEGDRPGVCRGQARLPSMIVTKAGGFGDPEALVRLCRRESRRLSE